MTMIVMMMKAPPAISSFWPLDTGISSMNNELKSNEALVASLCDQNLPNLKQCSIVLPLLPRPQGMLQSHLQRLPAQGY